MVLARYKAFPNVKSTGMFGLKPLVAFASDEVILVQKFWAFTNPDCDYRHITAQRKHHTGLALELTI